MARLELLPDPEMKPLYKVLIKIFQGETARWENTKGRLVGTTYDEIISLDDVLRNKIFSEVRKAKMDTKQEVVGEDED